MKKNLALENATATLNVAALNVVFAPLGHDNNILPGDVISVFESVTTDKDGNETSEFNAVIFGTTFHTDVYKMANVAVTFAARNYYATTTYKDGYNKAYSATESKKTISRKDKNGNEVTTTKDGVANAKLTAVTIPNAAFIGRSLYSVCYVSGNLVAVPFITADTALKDTALKMAQHYEVCKVSGKNFRAAAWLHTQRFVADCRRTADFVRLLNGNEITFESRDEKTWTDAHGMDEAAILRLIDEADGREAI